MHINYIKWTLANILICISTLVAAQIQILDDEFDNAATLNANWLNINQVEGWMAEHLEVFDINQTAPDRLYMMPWTTSWYEDLRGTLLFKLIDQDFVVTTEVTALNRSQSGLPSSSYSLAGVMLRTPRDYTPNALTDWTAGGENYVFLATGFAATNHPSCPGCPGPHFEVKSTVQSVSNLQVSSIATSQNVQIRVARIGSAIIVLYRLPSGNWQVHQRYERADFPAEIQVGLVTYTDWEKVGAYWQNNHEFYHNSHVINNQLTDDPTTGVPFNPDLIGQFDFVRYDEVAVPSELVAVDLVNVATDMQLLSFLGYDSCPYCPEDLHIDRTITNGQIVQASAINNLSIESMILAQASVSIQAGNTVELQPDFQVYPGAELEIKLEACDQMKP